MPKARNAPLKPTVPRASLPVYKAHKTVEERELEASAVGLRTRKTGIGVKTFAVHVGVPPSEMRRIAEMDVLPFKTATMAGLRIAYVEYLRKVAAGQIVVSGGEVINIDVERAKLTKQKVIGEVRHNQLQAGALVVKEDEIDRLLKSVLAAKSILRGIPKTARTKMGMSVANTQELATIIDKALLEVSREFGVVVDAPQYAKREQIQTTTKRPKDHSERRVRGPYKKKIRPAKAIV